MKIYLPWKIKCWDGKKYQAKLEINYTHTQSEDIMRVAELYRLEKEKENARILKKKLKNRNFRKCLGHKLPKVPKYNEHGQCDICGGYKY